MQRISKLSEIKKIELEILLELDDFCKRNNIQYYLAYGTLLGAVRHKGFIPWDDDIDVCMLIDDYWKFIKNYKNNRYRLMSVEREKRNHYTYAYAKLVDTKTMLIDKARPNPRIGINIDIFPLDYLGKDIEKAQKKLMKRYSRINYLETAYGLKGQILKIIGRKNIARGIRFLSRLKKKTSIVGNCCSINCSCDYYELKWFKETIKAPFEGHNFFAPKEYDSVLRERYGDYMKLPPEKDRCAPHAVEAYWR